MADSAALIEYATDGLEMPADRLLRRIVGWSSVAYGGQSLASSGLYVALAMNWVSKPPNMSWSLDGGLAGFVMPAQGLAMAALVAGGAMMLRRSAASLIVLRVSLVLSMGLTVLGLIAALLYNPVYASYWSTPATAASYTLQFLGQLWVPVLLLLLTLPPLARRMV